MEETCRMLRERSNRDLERLLEKIDGALRIHHDVCRGLVYAWFADSSLHIFDMTGRELEVLDAKDAAVKHEERGGKAQETD
jgi:hypothetical protein